MIRPITAPASSSTTCGRARRGRCGASFSRITASWPASVSHWSSCSGSHGAKKSTSSRAISRSAAASSTESRRVEVTPALSHQADPPPPGTIGGLRTTDKDVGAHRREVALWGATAGRALLGGVFVVAGVLKIPDPAEAVRAVRAYRLLPEALVGPVAFGMPVVEIAVGLALLAGVFVRAAAIAAAVLLVAFMGAVTSAWARGLQIDCGCFGGGGQVAAGRTAYPGEVARDVGLLLVALALARWPASRLALGSQEINGREPVHVR